MTPRSYAVGRIIALVVILVFFAAGTVALVEFTLAVGLELAAQLPDDESTS